jgi:hypothetical protein
MASTSTSAQRAAPARAFLRHRHPLAKLRFPFFLIAADLLLAAVAGGRTGAGAALHEMGQHVEGATFAPAGLLVHQPHPPQAVAQPVRSCTSLGAREVLAKATALFRNDARRWCTATAQSFLQVEGIRVTLRRCALLFPFHFFW